MSTTGPTVRTQPDKKNGRSPDVVVVPKQGGEFAGVSDLVGGSLIAAGAGTVEAQAARLGDARLAGIQRRAAAAQIGAKQGNQHLQRVVASVTQGASSVGGQLSSHSKHTPSNGPRAAGRGVAQPAAIDEPGTLELDSAPALAPGYGPSQPLGQNGSSDSTWVQRQKARSVQAVLDPELPSGPAAMVRSLPTPTPAPAQEEEKSDYFGSISGLRQAASSRIAVAVRDIPGYHLLTLVVGGDPVTDEAIERTPTDVLRTALSTIPGGDAIFQNLDESGAVDRAFAWLSNQLIKLNLTWETIKGLFRRAWEALFITDLVNPLGAWEKLRGIFLAPVIRLRNFVVSVGHKMLEFVFEGVMAKLDGGPVLALLQRAGGAFMQIVHNPIGFLSNLIGGVKQGLLNFVARIGDHLKTGLLSWLFGELAATGVEMPAEFNMRGLMALVMQVLGLTWQSIRTRAAKAFGERVVGVLERNFELFTIIREQGPGGLWEHVQKELGDLKETVLGGIQEMVVTQVIQAGVQWIVSLLGGPAGAVVKAITMIRDLVMWFVNTGSRVFALVNAIADSLGAIASGSIGVAAKAVEDTLGRMVPVAISFLASLLGLGDLGKKVLGIIEKVRERIDKLIGKVVASARKGFGKLSKRDRESEMQKQQRLDKGLSAAQSALERYAGKHVKERLLGPLLAVIRIRYRMTELVLIKNGRNYAIRGVVNPQKTENTSVPVSDGKLEPIVVLPETEEETSASALAGVVPTAAGASPQTTAPQLGDRTRIGKRLRRDLLEFWATKAADESDPVKRSRYRRFMENIQSRNRPTPSQAEEEYAYLRIKYSQALVEGIEPSAADAARKVKPSREIAFLGGKSVKGRPPGHTRPDIVHHGTAIEVKRYKIKNIASLIHRTMKQVSDRREHLPANQRLNQAIIVDLRGQIVSAAQIADLRQRLAAATGLGITNIEVLTW